MPVRGQRTHTNARTRKGRARPITGKSKFSIKVYKWQKQQQHHEFVVVKKNITSGVAHVNSTFNNTMITISDAQGNAIAWSSAGQAGLRGLVNLLPMPLRSLPKMLAVRPWSMGCGV